MSLALKKKTSLCCTAKHGCVGVRAQKKGSRDRQETSSIVVRRGCVWARRGWKGKDSETERQRDTKTRGVRAGEGERKEGRERWKAKRQRGGQEGRGRETDENWRGKRKVTPPHETQLFGLCCGSPVQITSDVTGLLYFLNIKTLIKSTPTKQMWTAGLRFQALLDVTHMWPLHILIQIPQFEALRAQGTSSAAAGIAEEEHQHDTPGSRAVAARGESAASWGHLMRRERNDS